jgi:hypothetical protein
MRLTIEPIEWQKPKAKERAAMSHDAMSMDYHEGPCLIQALEPAVGF